MKLENIGFYSLSDERIKNTSKTSQLKRCELIITDICNFKCPYCRGIKSEFRGTMPFKKIKKIIDMWAKDNLESIRLSGGEPTLHKHIVSIVKYAKSKKIKNIALSTNGSSDLSLYKKLIKAGVNDFSISLDACCATFGNKMSGIEGKWEKVVENIKELSKLVYTTVGIVVTNDTVKELKKTIEYADSLGVHDIRIISSAQYNHILVPALTIEEDVLAKYPILNYRIGNIKKGRNVRGIRKEDSNRCPLVLDDMAIVGDFHFPCVIYLREQGKPIGRVSKNIREEREKWFKNHNTQIDPICKKNCLDVCIDYNNRFRELRKDCYNAIDDFYTGECEICGKSISIITNEPDVKKTCPWCLPSAKGKIKIRRKSLA